MNTQELEAVARQLVAKGKGILAADESTGTITRRFSQVGLSSTEENRRRYRQLLFTTPEAEEFLSGVILFDETIRQKDEGGKPLPELLSERGIVPGIKVDRGAKEMAGFPGEKVTEGLDGLGERFSEYRSLGARFAKWRAVITIGEGRPSSACLWDNAHGLARYAALAQEADLVPIVEPEVLAEGDHSLERCEEVTFATLWRVFDVLKTHRVHLEGMLLKPNMVISGLSAPHRAGVEEVARATLRCLRRVVPPAVPGIAFLSGGQGPVEATEHLNAMNALGPQPWELTFSYGRALQEPPLKAWAGDPARVAEAQRLLYHRGKCNSAARHGRYSRKMEER